MLIKILKLQWTTYKNKYKKLINETPVQILGGIPKTADNR